MAIARRHPSAWLLAVQLLGVLLYPAMDEAGASRAVLSKVGFREEGLLKRYLDVDGAWRDHLLVAMTVEEVRGSVAAMLVRSGNAAWA